jgi:hypothetical protein
LNHFPLLGVLAVTYYLWIVIQQIIIGTLFLAALAYVARLIYKSLQAKGACATGCGKCAAVDFDKMEKEINSKLSLDHSKFKI